MIITRNNRFKTLLHCESLRFPLAYTVYESRATESTQEAHTAKKVGVFALDQTGTRLRWLFRALKQSKAYQRIDEGAAANTTNDIWETPAGEDHLDADRRAEGDY